MPLGRHPSQVENTITYLMLLLLWGVANHMAASLAEPAKPIDECQHRA